MWQRILTYRASEFKNVCSFVEICLCIGASNSTVDRQFSLLSKILTEKRLRISQKAMENCLLVATNSVNFTSAGRDQIINDAVNKYLQQMRKLLSSTQQKKRQRLLSDSDDSHEEDLSYLKEPPRLLLLVHFTLLIYHQMKTKIKYWMQMRVTTVMLKMTTLKKTKLSKMKKLTTKKWTKVKILLKTMKEKTNKNMMRWMLLCRHMFILSSWHLVIL